MLQFLDCPIEAALFDLDGTLVTTHIDFALMRAEVRRLAVAAGASRDTLGDDEILEMIDVAAAQLSEERADAFRRAARRRLEEIERAGARDAAPVAGASELLGRLRAAGVAVAVVTRNCRAVSAPLLQLFALPHDALLTRDDVARPKPDPAHLLDALAIVGVAPARALMTGDHWLDVRAGRDAGCAATLGVLGQRDADWFAPCRPDAAARDLAEALPLFV